MREHRARVWCVYANCGKCHIGGPGFVGGDEAELCEEVHHADAA